MLAGGEKAGGKIRVEERRRVGRMIGGQHIAGRESRGWRKNGMSDRMKGKRKRRKRRV